MKKYAYACLVVLFAVIAFLGTLNFIDQSLDEQVLTPPIDAAEYNYDYEENSTGQKQYVLTIQGEERLYNVYVSNKASSSSKKRPAIVLLHGAKRTGASLVDKWKDLADTHDLILIGPHSQGGWTIETDAKYFIPEMINEASDNYNIDPNKIYVFGHSMGGHFTFYLASLYSDLFAAAAIHAGKFLKPDHHAYVSKAKRKIPFMAMVGTDDDLFSVDEVRNSIQAYTNKGHKTKFIILKGHNHWYYDQAPFINAQAWEFFENISLD